MRARHTLSEGESVYCSLSWAEELRLAERRRRGARAARGDDPLLALLAGARAHPRSRMARADPAFGAGDQGPDLHAHRRDGRRARPRRCPRRRAASATGTTASRGSATRRSRCRRCTSSTSTGRPTSSCSSSPTSSPTRTARCRSCTGSTAAATSPRRTRDDLSGYAGARPVRIGNGAFDQRQNDVFGAALDSILLHTRRSQRLPRRLWPIVQSQAECATAVWREPDQGIWEARGEPQHYVSSKLMCWVAMDRAAKLAGDPRRARPRRDLGRHRGRDQGRHPRARRRRPRRAAPALRAPTRSTPRRCSRRSSASCPATTSACARASSRSPTS